MMAMRDLLELLQLIGPGGSPRLAGGRCRTADCYGCAGEVPHQGFVKVPECLVHGLVMPSRGRTRVASRALRRGAAAMLRWPCRRRMPMARLRRLTMARGAVPVRSWEAYAARV